MSNKEIDLSDMSYAKAGVSIKEQNRVNAEVMRRLALLGMKPEGLFGGAVNISRFRDQPFLDITGGTLETVVCEPKAAGHDLVHSIMEQVTGKPIGVLDYVALEVMKGDLVPDFVEGVALASSQHSTLVLGGESAEMKDTYQSGVFDAFVHVLSLGKEGGLDISPFIQGMERPLLVASTDGTGTKTKIVRNPEDIICHGLNDIGAQGVRPAAFALYISGNVPRRELDAIDSDANAISAYLGIHKFPSLITVKPEFYLRGEVDIAGTVVGFVDQDKIIKGASVVPGDVIIGIGVDGLMTNGYSLARKVRERLLKAAQEVQELFSYFNVQRSFREDLQKVVDRELSLPHRPMTDVLFGIGDNQGVLDRYAGLVKGMAHITGGGQPDNIPRMVPPAFKAVVQKNVLPVPTFMSACKSLGLPEEELYATFNMGPGFTLTVAEDVAQCMVDYITKQFSYSIQGYVRRSAIIGRIEERKSDEPRFMFADELK